MNVLTQIITSVKIYKHKLLVLDMQSRIAEFSDKEKGKNKDKQIEIFADIRENPFIADILTEMGAAVTERQMEVGDFLVSDRLVIERKTVSDFEASVIDGRLFDQAMRMEPYETPVMILEGERRIERIHENAFRGALVALVIDFGIQVLYSSNEEETAKLIYALAKREQIAERRPIRLLDKRKAHSLEHQQLRVLESFPDIGPVMAKKLLANFKNLNAVFNADPKELEKVLGKAKTAKFLSLISARYSQV